MLFREKLINQLNAYYDIEENHAILDETFSFLATFRQRNAKYVLHKKFEYYAFENNHYILFKRLEEGFSSKYMAQIDAWMKAGVNQLIDKEKEHMSSSITLVFETLLPTDPELVKAIKRYRYYQSFQWGIQGWVHGGLVLIEPDGNRGLSNKYSKKELKKFLS